MKQKTLARLVAVVAVVGLAVGLTSVAHATTAAIGLSPTSGVIGTKVTVTGTGYPKRVQGTVTLGATFVASIATTSRGSFSTSFAIPSTASGTVTVAASAGGMSASAALNVTSGETTSTTTTMPTATTTTMATTTTTTVPVTTTTSTTVQTTMPVPTSGTPPRNVIAVQGPTDPAALYAMVTWDRSDPSAVGYDVMRNGAVIGTVSVAGDAWDDLDFRDASVSAGASYDYQVRARYTDGTTSVASAPNRITIRSNFQIGSGRTFSVDAYTGTDVQRAQAAVNAAKAAGGGVVQFGARTYSFDTTLQVSLADNVILRGAGAGSTFLQPTFAGDSTSCGTGGQLVNFTGRQTSLATTLVAPVAVGDRTVRVATTAGLAPGQVIVLYEPSPVSNANSGDYPAAGVVQDPGTGRDERHRWDANEITGVDSTAGTVTFRHPWSQSYTTAAPWAVIDKGIGNGIERLTIQGRSSTEATHYSLVLLSNQARFAMADVDGRWTNRNYLRTSGYDIRVVGFRGTVGNPNGVKSTCQYQLSVWRTSNFSLFGGQLGEATHALNQSFITFQRSQRVTVRNSRFERSLTYAFNEHGLGSRDWVFENNYIATGPTATHAAVSLGHAEFGFSGAGIIRNNTFEGNNRDILLTENSYGVRVLDNTMRNTQQAVITGAGWAGPNTETTLYGSMRSTISRNTVIGGRGDGIVLGMGNSGYFAYVGVKDVVIESNALDVLGTAIRLEGDSGSTQRFQVRFNTGVARYIRPAFVVGDHWVGNADGVTFGTATEVPWTQA